MSDIIRFLKLYGRRFSRDDHVLFIRLLYELVTLPQLEPHSVQNHGRLLLQLLKWVERAHTRTHAHTQTHTDAHRRTCRPATATLGKNMKRPDQVPDGSPWFWVWTLADPTSAKHSPEQV